MRKIVHGKPPCAPIPISKWVNIFKFGMEASRSSQCILFGYVLQLTKQFAKFFLYVLGCAAPTSLFPVTKVVAFVSTGTFTKLPSARIVGVLGE